MYVRPETLPMSDPIEILSALLFVAVIGYGAVYFHKLIKAGK